MAWGDPSDYWWLQPKQSRLVSNVQAGAALAQQNIENRRRNTLMQLEQKQSVLNAQKAQLEIKRYFDGEELRTKTLAGNTALMDAVKGVQDWTSLDSVRSIAEVGRTYPFLVGTPQYADAMKMHENAVKAKADMDKATLGADSREKIAEMRIQWQQQKQEADTLFNKDKLRLWERNAALKERAIEYRKQYDAAELEADAELRRARIAKINADIASDKERERVSQEQLDIARQRANAYEKSVSAGNSDVAKEKFRAEVAALKSKFEAGGYLPDGADKIFPLAKDVQAATAAYMRELDAAADKHFGKGDGGRSPGAGGKPKAAAPAGGDPLGLGIENKTDDPLGLNL